MVTDVWLRTAYSYLYIRDFEAAKRIFRKAIEEQPDNPIYHFHASITALRSGDNEFAALSAQRAAELDTSNEMYREHLSFVKGKQLVASALYELERGDFPEAKRRFQEAALEDPLNEEAASALTWLESLQGKSN